MASTKSQRIPFGKYLLLDRINVGGMAEVWRGKTRDSSTQLDELVAIKRILPGISEDQEFVAMFIDEAKITVQLSHPNIGQIRELGQINGSYYIAMDYISAKDLRAIFDRCGRLGEPAPVPLSSYVVSLMCDALDHAHRKKDSQGRPMDVIHRDVSPQNILVTYDGDVKVIDFGIAKAAGRISRTQAGILKGKFAYMSPEQIYQSNFDHRSDIFSIGTCFHELLTGRRLFAGDSDFTILEKVRKAEVPAPSKINPRVPSAVEAIVLRALAREPANRYSFASEMADALRRYLASLKEPFGRTQLGAYMRSCFAEDLEAENARRREYDSITLDELMLERPNNSFAIRPAKPSRVEPQRPVSITAPSAPAEPDTLEERPGEPRTKVPKHAVVRKTALEPPPSPAAKVPTIGANSRWMLGLFGAFLGGAALATAVLNGPMKQQSGYLLLDVPEDLRPKTTITLDGRQQPRPNQWPVLRAYPVGPVVVTLNAEGFEPYTAVATVAPGDTVARVEANLRPIQ